jgi:hypothetical protein
VTLGVNCFGQNLDFDDAHSIGRLTQRLRREIETRMTRKTDTGDGPEGLTRATDTRNNLITD